MSARLKGRNPPRAFQHLPAMTGIPVRNLLPSVSPSLRLWESKPSHPAKYVSLGLTQQPVSLRAADCKRADPRHGWYLPSARPVSGIGKPAEEQMRFRHCHTPSKEAGPPYAEHVYGTAIPPRLPAQSLTARRTTKEAPPLSVCRVWRRRGTGLVVSCHPLSTWRQQDRGQTQRL